MIQYLSQLDGKILQNKKVFLRLDLNVAMYEGEIIDAQRIISSLPTIDYLVKHKAKIIICSHLGRPEGKPSPEYSLVKVYEYLKNAGYNIGFNTQDITTLDAIEFGKHNVVLLENIRFYPQEEQGDAAFAQKLAQLADIYINDAFACSHRAHASIAGITKHMHNKVYAGPLLEMEVKQLEDFLGAAKSRVSEQNAKRADREKRFELVKHQGSIYYRRKKQAKVLVIMGGKKVSDKFAVLQNLLQQVDYIYLAGGMANTALASYDYSMGSSYVEKSILKELEALLLRPTHGQVLLPSDFICLKDDKVRMLELGKITPKDIALDLGDKSLFDLKNLIDECQFVIWNGPLGMYEDERFSYGTRDIAHYIAARTTAGHCKSLAGGGDVVAAINLCGLSSQFTYISTAGGAFLEWMEGKELPGLKALQKNCVKS